MIELETQAGPQQRKLLGALPPRQVWHNVAIMVDGTPDEAACSLALALSERDRARLILYDTSSDSFWSSPFPPGENVHPLLLGEADLRRVGRDTVADTLRDLKNRGADAWAHISTKGQGEDLASLTRRERIDLILCPVPLEGRRGGHVHRSRRHGASVLECPPDREPTFHGPLSMDDALPVDERVEPRVLVALVLTFLVALFRNR